MNIPLGRNSLDTKRYSYQPINGRVDKNLQANISTPLATKLKGLFNCNEYGRTLDSTLSKKDFIEDDLPLLKSYITNTHLPLIKLRGAESPSDYNSLSSSVDQSCNFTLINPSNSPLK